MQDDQNTQGQGTQDEPVVQFEPSPTLEREVEEGGEDEGMSDQGSLRNQMEDGEDRNLPVQNDAGDGSDLEGMDPPLREDLAEGGGMDENDSEEGDDEDMEDTDGEDEELTTSGDGNSSSELSEDDDETDEEMEDAA